MFRFVFLLNDFSMKLLIIDKYLFTNSGYTIYPISYLHLVYTLHFSITTMLLNKIVKPLLRIYKSMNIVAVWQQYTQIYITSGYRLLTAGSWVDSRHFVHIIDLPSTLVIVVRNLKIKKLILTSCLNYFANFRVWLNCKFLGKYVYFNFLFIYERF